MKVTLLFDISLIFLRFEIFVLLNIAYSAPSQSIFRKSIVDNVFSLNISSRDVTNRFMYAYISGVIHLNISSQ